MAHQRMQSSTKGCVVDGVTIECSESFVGEAAGSRVDCRVGCRFQSERRLREQSRVRCDAGDVRCGARGRNGGGQVAGKVRRSGQLE